MSTAPRPIRPITDLLLAFAGPIVWAGHFFGVYLNEAVLCPTQGAAPVRAVGAMLTVSALAIVVAAAVHHRGNGPAAADSDALAFAFPLTLLSGLAVLWTSVPLFLLPACATAGA